MWFWKCADETFESDGAFQAMRTQKNQYRTSITYFRTMTHYVWLACKQTSSVVFLSWTLLLVDSCNELAVVVESFHWFSLVAEISCSHFTYFLRLGYYWRNPRSFFGGEDGKILSGFRDDLKASGFGVQLSLSCPTWQTPLRAMLTFLHFDSSKCSVADTFKCFIGISFKSYSSPASTSFDMAQKHV